MSAADAQAMGMIWRVVPAASLMDEASALARHLASQPTRGLGLTKRALNASLANDLDAQLELEAELQAEAGAGQLLVSDDVRRQLRGRAEFDFRELGTRALKGVLEPVQIYAVGARSEDSADGAGHAGGAASARQGGRAGPDVRGDQRRSRRPDHLGRRGNRA
jgi:hypothetical protein